MNESRWEETLAELIDAHVAGRSHSHDDLGTGGEAEVVELLNVADLLWEAAHGAPPLERDPVAAMLGLVPDPSRSLDRESLQRVLQSAGVRISTLAQKLSQRGWEVATRDVFNWQTRDNAAVPPALIQAIAEIAGVSPEELTVDRGGTPSHVALKSVTSSAKFHELAERWARLRRTTVDLGASALEARLAASMFRGTEPSGNQMLASLDALISALESKADPRKT